ncbi:lysozyme inhibitor LprI family protein [Novosphingobium cyanobacteriorum]|uniref:Lysozyme inhibitor LprI family protein n=1 Tax=Novosphingobium cyanobacteriorum TaxID=3024215 RepID=A0ABT6CLD5_9SPHN|nr:lysozyme inhibitor LprI family protein [Novosphingobium cyanobacteriorum]MDF8333900.1 lysozyme inhibitor LprI family protein [Novosphingobium cyanobacteriorum]
MIAAITLMLTAPLAVVGSADEYSLPQCHEDVATGVWWPDLSCARNEFKNADAALNKVWKTVIKGTVSTQKSRLISDQRHWLSQMQATCAAIRDQSGEPAILEYRKLACKADLTLQRTKVLRRLVRR